MVASPVIAIAVLSAVVTVCACAEAASAKSSRSRHPAAFRSFPAHGQMGLRKKTPAAHAPTQDDKAWMERASAPSNGGGGGGM
jgi:hypothetical protein